MPISHRHQPYEYSNYVPEIEASDAIKAVELKQNLYNQGIAQIKAKQQELYNFDIARDVDRKYVSEALDDINKTIKDNAHMDFSNPNTVMSFLDISKPLEEDLNFKNAIRSTKELRNRQNFLNELITKKPQFYSEANVYHYMKDIEDWQNNPNPGATLNSKEYTPFEDITPLIQSITNKAKADFESEMTVAGKWLNTQTIQSLKAEKITNMINSTLNEKQLNQLRIDAEFEAAKLPFESKASYMQSYYQNIANTYAKESYNRNLSQEERDLYKQKALAAAETSQEIMSYSKEELDYLYSNFYITNWSEGIGKAYEFKSIKNELKANPYAVANQASSLRIQEANNKLKNDKELLKYKYDNGFYSKSGKSKNSDSEDESSVGILQDKFYNQEAMKSLKVPGNTYKTSFQNLKASLKNSILNEFEITSDEEPSIEKFEIMKDVNNGYLLTFVLNNEKYEKRINEDEMSNITSNELFSIDNIIQEEEVYNAMSDEQLLDLVPESEVERITKTIK